MKMAEDRSILGASQTAILVGAVIQENDRYLLVQEAKTICRGKWNFPGGHLKPGESIPTGVIREVKEETGHDVELTGFCSLINCVSPHGTLILIPFTARIISTTSVPNHDEILATDWFSRANIESIRDQLRFPDLAIDLIRQIEDGHIFPLDLLKIYQ